MIKVILNAEWFTNKRLPKYKGFTSTLLMFIVDNKIYIGEHHCNGHFYNHIFDKNKVILQYKFDEKDISFWAYYENIELQIK